MEQVLCTDDRTLQVMRIERSSIICLSSGVGIQTVSSALGLWVTGAGMVSLCAFVSGVAACKNPMEIYQWLQTHETAEFPSKTCPGLQKAKSIPARPVQAFAEGQEI